MTDTYQNTLKDFERDLINYGLQSKLALGHDGDFCQNDIDMQYLLYGLDNRPEKLINVINILAINGSQAHINDEIYRSMYKPKLYDRILGLYKKHLNYMMEYYRFLAKHNNASANKLTTEYHSKLIN